MSIAAHLTVWRRLRMRPFRDIALELEFRGVFRSAGIRFFEIAAAMAGLAYVAFFTIYAVSNPQSVLSQPQPLRLVMVVALLATAVATRYAKPFVSRHYEIIFPAVVILSIGCTTVIASMNQVSESPYSRYWGLYSAAVMSTCIIYGFARLSTPSTLLLAAFNVGIAIWFAKDYGGDGRGMQRLIVHLVSVNVLCYALYRLITMRERKLFLRSKRQRGIIQLRRARDRAEEASRAKSAFLANMSHEIRTPMNGIIGSLALIDRTDSDEKRRTLVKVAREAAAGLLQTLNEILDYAKLDATGGSLHVAPFDPRRVCELAVQTFQANAIAKGIALRFDAQPYPADLQFVDGDEEKVRRIVMNLVSNAIKFTTAGGVTLRLRATRVGARVRLAIRIADTGIGIPRDKVPLLFDPFYQVDSGTTRSYGGTGLGLAISRQLAQAMGGGIRVKSLIGKGSLFAVDLVFDENRDKRPVPEAEISAPMLLDPAAIAGKRVLLVEDNTVNAFISAASLETLGVRSLLASDGRQAVDLFRSERFDAVLMDCEMPEMDGFAATKLIREFEARSGRTRTPIIALTANALSGDREHCLARGMDDYLSKPIELRQLAAMVARWIGSGPPVADDSNSEPRGLEMLSRVA